jgi:hypothetical protein
MKRSHYLLSDIAGAQRPDREHFPSWLARVRGNATKCGRRTLLRDMDLPQRIAQHLAYAEIREPDAWRRDDYHIAILTVFFAANGNPDPWRFAFWWYLGRTPEKLIPEFVARAERHAAMETEPLGGKTLQSSPGEAAQPAQLLSPKKPAHGVYLRKAA